ncbi:uncharacterized protein LOC124675503 [Lolium rigidum]|uniref:uncharacterized protein LOC124675503 n=1 Tax=Lolium rigidum TaxID=89674 RepID=UPI001F5C582F|nr:uncharacterized protein LOC124675503 [Lolium rigidum]
MAATDEREAGHTVQEREELTPRKRDPIEEQCLRDPNEGTARFQVIEADEKRGRSRSTRAPGAAVPWWGGKLGIGVGREAARWGIQREFLAMWCDINLLDAFGDVSGKAVVTMCVLQTRVLRKGEGKMLRLDGSDIICYSTYEYVEGYFDGNHADYDLNDEVADIYTELLAGTAQTTYLTKVIHRLWWQVMLGHHRHLSLAPLCRGRCTISATNDRAWVETARVHAPTGELACYSQRASSSRMFAAVHPHGTRIAFRRHQIGVS